MFMVVFVFCFFISRAIYKEFWDQVQYGGTKVPTLIFLPIIFQINNITISKMLFFFFFFYESIYCKSIKTTCKKPSKIEEKIFIFDQLSSLFLRHFSPPKILRKQLLFLKINSISSFFLCFPFLRFHLWELYFLNYFFAKDKNNQNSEFKFRIMRQVKDWIK